MPRFNFLNKNTKYLQSGLLLVGFLTDYFTLRRIDFLIENVIFILYIAISAVALIIFSKDWLKEAKSRLSLISSFVFQLTTGGLLSGFFVFYIRGADLVTHFLFAILIILLVLVLEFSSKAKNSLLVRITLLFFLFYSYLIIAIPVFTKRISDYTFLLSGVASAILFTLFWRFILGRILVNVITSRHVYLSLGAVLLIVNVFYFSNIIPPLPLALIDSGQFNDVYRENNGVYVLIREKRSFLERLRSYQEITIKPGEPVYYFASVFAPAKLETTIMHNWEYFEEGGRGWVSQSIVTYKIYGGADGGYRGYSLKTNLKEGRWRVSVVTASGRIIGRSNFYVNYGMPGGFQTTYR